MYKQLEEKTILKFLKPYSVNHSKLTSNIDVHLKKLQFDFKYDDSFINIQNDTS
jgi:hypothetical protein